MELKKSALTIGLLVGIFWAMLPQAGEPFVKGVTEWSFSVGYGESFSVTPLFVYNFNNYKKVTPYVEIGFGILATDLDPEGFGSDFGFTPQAGIGVRYPVSDRQMIKLAYRYHHISNGGLKDDNQSIDTNFFFIGYSFLH